MPASVTQTTRLSLRLTADLRERLEALARARDRSPSYEARQAIKAYVEANGREAA